MALQFSLKINWVIACWIACIIIKFCNDSTTIIAGCMISSEDYSVFLQYLDQRWTAAGDWNAEYEHWYFYTTTSKDQQLYSALRGCNATYVLNSLSTYWPTDINNLPDCVYLFLINGISSEHMTAHNFHRTSPSDILRSY